MQRFLLFLTLSINIANITDLQGEIFPSFVRIDPPSYVIVDNSFVTSLIFKIDVVTTESVHIKFKKPNSIGISAATFKSWLGEENIPISPNGENKNEVILKLDAERYALDANEMYQILLDCYTPKPLSLNKNLFVWENEIDKKNEMTIQFEDESKIEELQVYETQRAAGNSIKLKGNSNLKFNLKNHELNNLYIEFWMKSHEKAKDFFTIKSSINDDTILAFSKNQFYFLTFPINDDEVVREDIYLGTNNWNYFGLAITNNLGTTRVSTYVNSSLVYSMIVENELSFNDLIIKFGADEENTVFELDRLKIWKFNNNLALADKNKHFLNYEADSSKVIFQSSFENANEFLEDYSIGNLKISGNNLNYVKSDAPLFSKAPKLTVNIGSSYNSIVWYVQEFSVAKKFEIERSISGGEYITVYSTLAEDDPLKIYYFTDELINEHEVAYYRVKQINEDGTQVYSAEVKIGNRDFEEFKLGQNYPNPFNPITSIYVEVMTASEFKVNVYDLVGNTVARLYNGFLAEGMHTFEFDGSSLPSGIYFYEVISPSSQSVKKMILAK